GKPYRPMADGRCPFSAEDLAGAGFETLVRDGVDDEAARALGAALGWDKPPVNMKLEEGLFALITVARKKPLAERCLPTEHAGCGRSVIHGPSGFILKARHRR